MVIGASLTAVGYVLPLVLAELLRRSSGIEIQLKVSPPHECVAAMKAGECDLVIAHVDPGQNVDGLDIIRVRDERGGSRHGIEEAARCGSSRRRAWTCSCRSTRSSGRTRRSRPSRKGACLRAAGTDVHRAAQPAAAMTA